MSAFHRWLLRHRPPIGHGATEQEAIEDLKAQVVEKREWWLSPNGQNVYDSQEKAISSTIEFEPPIHVQEVTP